MITGDKQETAINIAIACKLVHHIKDLLIVNAHQSEEAAQARLQDLLALCKASNPGATRGSVSVKAGLDQSHVLCCCPWSKHGWGIFPQDAHARGRQSPRGLCLSQRDTTFLGHYNRPAGRVLAEAHGLGVIRCAHSIP